VCEPGHKDTKSSHESGIIQLNQFVEGREIFPRYKELAGRKVGMCGVAHERLSCAMHTWKWFHTAESICVNTIL